MPTRCLPFLICLLVLPACGGAVYAPARTAGFELDDPREIDDEDIAKAFLARPQMSEELRVAYYVFDEDHAEEVKMMLETAPTVVSTYRIPSLMVTGERRFDEQNPYASPERKPVRLKQLRLLAARARADVLIVVDYGYEVKKQANGWAAFGAAAFVPLLFVPWLDVEVKSYVDSYVIDVRNGFLYGHLSTNGEGEETQQTVHSDADQTLIEDQLKALLAQTGVLLGKLVTDERNRLKDTATGKEDAPLAQTAP